MKVLLLNGSPNENRCTYTALAQVADGLNAFGVDAEIKWLGKEAVKPCVGCFACNKTKRCAFGDDDGINELIEELIAADAIVLGSPVYFAGIQGSFKAVLDRAFFAPGPVYAFKPGAAVVSARRAGTTASLDQLNKYFVIAQMVLAGSFYWPMVHGTKAEEVLQDAEGCQAAWQTGANIAWLLKCLEAGKAAGIEPYRPPKRAWTNFIRSN